MKNIILMFFYTLQLLKGFFVYIFTSKTPDSAYQAMIGLFCKTGGVSSDFLHRIVMLFNPKYSLEKQSGLLGNFTAHDSEQIAQKIREYGYYVFEQKLSDELCDKLMEFATQSQCMVRRMHIQDSETLGTELVHYDPNDRKAIRYDYSQESLINDATVQKILADYSLISVAQEYLKSSPILDIISMWWHTDFDKEPNAESATMYHFDMDRIKWLKFFFYLTDVDEKSGPHTFIKGSHKTGAIPEKFLRRGYARLSDEEVLDHYGKDKEIVYTAPRGTIIAEDTRGLHKGAPVLQGHRLVFQIECSNSLFGGTYAPVKFKNITSELKNMIEKYPKIYAQYT